MKEGRRLFSQGAIAIATYIGSPLAAGYLVRKNYQAAGQNSNGNRALIIGIISTFILFGGIFMLPDHIVEALPKILIPTIYIAIVYFVVERYQGVLLNSHKELGGVFYSAWRAVGIGFISLLIVSIGVVLPVVLVEVYMPGYDVELYDSEIAQLYENETIAIDMISMNSSVDDVNRAIALWEENLEIVNRLNNIEDLPAEFVENNTLLIKYCKLHIDFNVAFIAATSQDATDEDIVELDRIGTLIDELVGSHVEQ